MKSNILALMIIVFVATSASGAFFTSMRIDAADFTLILQGQHQQTNGPQTWGFSDSETVNMISENFRYYYYYAHNYDSLPHQDSRYQIYEGRRYETISLGYQNAHSKTLEELINERPPNVPAEIVIYTIQLCYGENDIRLYNWLGTRRNNIEELFWLERIGEEYGEIFSFRSASSGWPLPFYVHRYSSGYNAIRYGMYGNYRDASRFNDEVISKMGIAGQIIKTRMNLDEFKRYWTTEFQY